MKFVTHHARDGWYFVLVDDSAEGQGTPVMASGVYPDEDSARASIATIKETAGSAEVSRSVSNIPYRPVISPDGT